MKEAHIFRISTNTLSLWIKQKRERRSLEKNRFYESKIGENISKKIYLFRFIGI